MNLNWARDIRSSGNSSVSSTTLHDNSATMNVASAARPAGCLKSVFRRTRYQRTFQRCLSAVVETPPTTILVVAPADAPTTTPATISALVPKARRGVRQEFSARQRSDTEKVSKFNIWPQIPSIRATHPDPMPFLRQKQIAKLDPTGSRTRLFSREHADSAKVGDVLMVSTKAGEPFAGAFIQIRRRGQDTAILLRGQMMKVGVEMWFKIYSPTTTGIDIIWRRQKRARRARLTYMRKPSHDMGSVDQLVFAWKKEREVPTAAQQRAALLEPSASPIFVYTPKPKRNKPTYAHAHALTLAHADYANNNQQHSQSPPTASASSRSSNISTASTGPGSVDPSTHTTEARSCPHAARPRLCSASSPTPRSRRDKKQLHAARAAAPTKLRIEPFIGHKG
ncbi:hypothetical protein G7046_g6414 [Stylonectria norvegica]|nr:hypothetical protein G7046_g6414 [Stylonectria norvegica]